MNTGAFGEGFPYSNFHDLNMDWIIKIAKDFLDQYTHIQETIDNGLQELEDKKDTLEALLQAWYDTHSADIANQLADALQDLNSWYTTHQNYLNQTLINKTAEFNASADAKAQQAIASIPSDYTALYNQVQDIQRAFQISENFILADGELYVYNPDITFEQGIFTASGDNESTTWIRTPNNNKLANNFIIYNPYRLQWAIGAFYGNEFLGWDNNAGTEVVVPSIFRDQYAKVYDTQDRNWEYRVRVSRYLASSDLTPAQSTLKIFTKYETRKQGVYRKPNVATGNGTLLVGGHLLTPGENYRYTDVFKLYNGETIRFEYAGPSNLVALSEWTPTADGSNPKFNPTAELVTGNGKYNVAEYTAQHDMYIRVSTMIYPVNHKPYTNPNDTVSNIIIFRKETYYNKTNPLYGKTITLMGDSLSSGSIAGSGSVWLQRLALEFNMTAYNMSVDGNAITSGYGTGDAISIRYIDIPESDYIVIGGGANDKRENAPTGNFWADSVNFIMNTDPTTFKGALNTIISGLRSMYPKAKLMFITDFDRYPSKSHEQVDAMKEVCEMRSVVCYDNFANSGVAVCENGLDEWQDQGLWLNSAADYHLTPDVYKNLLLPRYRDTLENT